jgi:transposase-like protein
VSLQRTDGVLSEALARRLTDDIKAAVADVWLRISEAYQGRAWLALGYDSWDAYCAAEFAGGRLQLPREERREIVASLRESGLSVRAIASATGSSKSAVSRALPTVPNGTVEVSPAPTSAPEVEPRFKASVKPAAKVTGTNGKSYEPPAPKPAEPRVDPFAADRYRAIFLKDMARVVGTLATYSGSVERLAEVADAETWGALDSLERVAKELTDKARALKPAGLRVVG